MSECVNSKAWPAWVRQLLPVLVIVGIATAAPPDAVFRVDGQRPTAAVITVGESWDQSMPLDTPMGRLAAGVLDRYDTRSIAKLLRCATRQPMPADAQARRVAVIHLAGARPGPGRQVELMRLADGSWCAREIPLGAGIILDADRFEAVTSSWPVYRGGFGHAPDPHTRAASVALTKPYTAGDITLDVRTQKQRLYRGMPIRTVPPTACSTPKQCTCVFQTATTLASRPGFSSGAARPPAGRSPVSSVPSWMN